MEKRHWILLFVIILAVNITGGLIKNQWVEYVSKPLIVITLALYFISQTNTAASRLKRLILVALFFSWAGDVLLIFQESDKAFFIAGLIMFLNAHVFYIVFFHMVKVKEYIRSNIWLLVIAVVYYVALISFLSPFLGGMKLPVRVYGVFISFMFMLAIHMLFIKDKTAGRWMMTGALLFVLSDSVLAINKFYKTFELADLTIMLTYGLAQLFIVEGAIKYITSGHKE